MALTGVEQLMPMLGRHALQLLQADVAGGEVGCGGGPSRMEGRTAWLRARSWSRAQGGGQGQAGAGVWDSKQGGTEAFSLTCSPGCPAGPG